MDRPDLDAWVRLTDFELGGDAYWSADGVIVHDAEGDTLCTAINEDAALVIAAAMNRLADAADVELAEVINEARSRVADEAETLREEH